MATASWLAQLAGLTDARSLPAAQQATAELIDYALPGGSAVVNDGADLVRAIAEIPNLRTHAFRACMLWVLVLMSRWIGAWQRAAASVGAGPLAQEAADSELETERQMRLAARELADMVLDNDPEVRSMTYRLVGSALPMDEAMEIIGEHLAGENDELARACGIEATAIAMAKAWPDVTADQLDWLRGLISVGGRAVQGRLRHLLEGRAAIGIADAARTMLPEFSKDLAGLPSEGPFWPVELI